MRHFFFLTVVISFPTQHTLYASSPLLSPLLFFPQYNISFLPTFYRHWLDIDFDKVRSCHTVVVTVDLAVEAMAAEDILMGTMTIIAATQVDIQDLETILQPTPTGMTILGLELKSKFAWCLVLEQNLT